ncbi:TetR/AcrR family transcriptional regulator [Agromyces sp. NPDC049794]|uniref:TetR/AcrR family transcriptional regulator n=1 Tax=Agromyces sp. NPDC049794 TaxID=3154362 RepID=UPI003402DFD1
MRRAAMEELRREGPAGLSLRAVARRVGIAVSALYRYYPSRDDLLTDLLVTAFDDHADAVQAAADAPDVRDALCGAFRAYRAWGLDHPAEFSLAYGTPVPGYVAPADRTVRAGSRIGDLLMGLLHRADEQGLIRPEAIRERDQRLTGDTRRQLQTLADRRRYPLTPALIALGLDLFVNVQGLVILEIFGHLRPITPDATPYVNETIETHVDGLLVDHRPS